MNSKLTSERERKLLVKLVQHQFPNRFKKIGMVIIVISLLCFFANKFIIDSFTARQICKYGILLGLVIISLSKEIIEDELIIKLRMQSYAAAFIFTVFFSIIHPVLRFLLDFYVSVETTELKTNGDFLILSILLIFQILTFHSLKSST